MYVSCCPTLESERFFSGIPTAMAPRRRPKKVGLKRIDAAVDALRPIGFSKDIVHKTVNALLKVYDGNWVFIEEGSYKLLIETILEEQEKTGGITVKDEICAIESEEQKITGPFAAECAKEVTEVGETSTARGLMGLMTETGLQEDISTRDANSPRHGLRLEGIDHHVLKPKKNFLSGLQEDISTRDADSARHGLRLERIDHHALKPKKNILSGLQENISTRDADSAGHGLRLERIDHHVLKPKKKFLSGLQEDISTRDADSAGHGLRLERIDHHVLKPKKDFLSGLQEDISTRNADSAGHGLRLERIDRIRPIAICESTQVRRDSETVPSHLQPLATPVIRRRKPCYGWISDDDEDEEEDTKTGLVVREKAGTKQCMDMFDLGKGGKRKARWDVKPEDM